MRISSARIRKSGVLVRDLIPVLDKNGVPCMLDRLTNNLYYNQGTGTFAYEEWDMTPVDYVYCDGNAYTNTNEYGNSNTKMEMVMDIKETPSGNTGSMGSRGNSANENLLAVGYGASGALAVDFNNSGYASYRAMIQFETNKKYKCYTSKESRSIIDGDTGVVLAENNTLCNDTMATDALLLGAETGVALRHTGRIYSARIWNGSDLIRDYIPVVDSDNVAGLYDKCTNNIFYSLGTSEFEAHIIKGNDDYKVVSLIESVTSNTSNGPYIDTGITYFADFELTAKQRTSASMKGCGVDQTHCVERENATTNCWRFRTGQSDFFNTSLLVTDKHSLKWKNNEVFGDGVKLGNFTKTDVTNTFLIFASNAAGTQPVNRYSLLVYGCKMWDTVTGTLIRKFIPVVKNNEAGLFDVVNKQWYSNAGNDSFSYE